MYVRFPETIYICLFQWRPIIRDLLQSGPGYYPGNWLYVGKILRDQVYCRAPAPEKTGYDRPPDHDCVARFVGVCTGACTLQFYISFYQRIPAGHDLGANFWLPGRAPDY